eukprot:Phypoly_transcript_13281.p1 GENE.Phypoly_transcript_13281~~Phypoly_transcript_13281.p1  ORF type:complete len:268 (+),score=55.22 Phypoly_transcript_13281:82-885(+)
MAEREYLTGVEEKRVDYGKVSSLYAEHRPGFPPEFYERLARIIDVKGKRVLDIGAGPGIIALELAKRGAEVVGQDFSAEQIEAAKDLAQKLGLQDRCKFEVAPAEDTKQPDHYFDLVTAGTCWHWFNNEKACAEVRRVLKPGGLLLVASYLYVSTEDKLAGETEALIHKYNPKYTLKPLDGFCHDLYGKLVLQGKFKFVEQHCFDFAQPFTQEGWLKRIQAHSGVGAGMNSEQLQAFSAELTKLMHDNYPQNLHITHRVYNVFVESQ